jgi:hypothetical protein
LSVPEEEAGLRDSRNCWIASWQFERFLYGSHMRSSSFFHWTTQQPKQYHKMACERGLYTTRQSYLHQINQQNEPTLLTIHLASQSIHPQPPKQNLPCNEQQLNGETCNRTVHTICAIAQVPTLITIQNRESDLLPQWNTPPPGEPPGVGTILRPPRRPPETVIKRSSGDTDGGP